MFNLQRLKNDLNHLDLKDTINWSKRFIERRDLYKSCELCKREASYIFSRTSKISNNTYEHVFCFSCLMYYFKNEEFKLVG